MLRDRVPGRSESLDSSAQEKWVYSQVLRGRRVSVVTRSVAYFTRGYYALQGSIILSGNQTFSPNSVYCTVNVTLILIHLQIRELVTALHHWFIVVQVLVIGEYIFQHLLLSEMQPHSHALSVFR